MKLLITVLLLATGLNQILARYVPWDGRDHAFFMHDDSYDPFRMYPHQPTEDFYKFKFGGIESEEESKGFLRPTSSDQSLEHLGGFFNVLLDSFLEIGDDDDIKSDEKVLDDSQEQRENTDDDEKDVIDTFLLQLFASEKQDEKSKSSEEETKADKVFEPYWKPRESEETEDKSSEKITYSKNDESQENSNEKTQNMEVEIFDLTKSSEEEKQEKNDRSEETSNEEADSTDLQSSAKEKENEVNQAVSEDDLKELVAVYMTLHYLDNLIGEKAEKEEIEKAKEVDAILTGIAMALDSVTAEDAYAKKTEKESQEKEYSNESDNESKIKSTTIKTISEEEEKSSEEVAPTTEGNSNESPEDEKDNKSNSNEDEFHYVSFVFQGAGPQGEQPSLNDHKYSLINSQNEIQPTSAPFMPETASPTSTVAQHSINEYAEIRENLDAQQNYLQKHELDLDKDFYAIISSNYDEESLNKFENDIYVVHENLDRIKRNINAIQNLQSKLYFHKLVSAAVKEAQIKNSK